MIDQPFAAYTAPARHRPQIWRVLAGLVVVVVTMIAWLGVVFGALALLFGTTSALDWLGRLTIPVTPAPALLLLSSFVGMGLGTVLAARLLHRRGAGTLIGPRGRATRDFAIAIGVVVAVYGISLAVWSGGAPPQPNLPPPVWLAFLPVALLGIFIQTGAEELLFRGYLMQQVAARSNSRWLAYLLPSAIFGLLHLDPATMGTNAWPIVVSTTLVGLIAADLTWVTGSLGAAWGLHFANNVAALTVVATKGTITGLALYVTPYPADSLSPLVLVIDAAMLVAIWLVLRRVLRR